MGSQILLTPPTNFVDPKTKICGPLQLFFFTLEPYIFPSPKKILYPQQLFLDPPTNFVDPSDKILLLLDKTLAFGVLAIKEFGHKLFD